MVCDHLDCFHALLDGHPFFAGNYPLIHGMTNALMPSFMNSALWQVVKKGLLKSYGVAPQMKQLVMWGQDNLMQPLRMF